MNKKFLWAKVKPIEKNHKDRAYYGSKSEADPVVVFQYCLLAHPKLVNQSVFAGNCFAVGLPFQRVEKKLNFFQQHCSNSWNKLGTMIPRYSIRTCNSATCRWWYHGDQFQIPSMRFVIRPLLHGTKFFIWKHSFLVEPSHQNGFKTQCDGWCATYSCQSSLCYHSSTCTSQTGSWVNYWNPI